MDVDVPHSARSARRGATGTTAKRAHLEKFTVGNRERCLGRNALEKCTQGSHALHRLLPRAHTASTDTEM